MKYAWLIENMKCHCTFVMYVVTTCESFFVSPETIPPSVHVDAANVSVLTVGDTYRVICEASGVPEPTVLWIKDGADVNTLGGKRISNRAGKLKIKDVVTSDSGEYVCRADDGQGNIEEKVLVLQVQDGKLLNLVYLLLQVQEGMFL